MTFKSMNRLQSPDCKEGNSEADADSRLTSELREMRRDVDLFPPVLGQ